MTSEYCLEVLCLKELRWDHPLHSRTPNLYAEVRLGDVTRRTRTIKRDASPRWNERLVSSSDADDNAILEAQVKHDSSWLSDLSVGHVKAKLNDLLKRSAEGKAIYELTASGQGATAPTGRIALRLEAIDSTKAAQVDIDSAVEDFRQRGILSPDESSSETQENSSRDNLYQAVGELLSKLQVFRNVGDTLSEVHPFVTVAWTLVSGLYDATSRVFEIDNKLVDLVINMRDAFMFVNDVQSLPNKVASLQGPITGLLKQTIECCLFVRYYTAQTFLKRMLDADSGQKVNAFQEALAKLKKEIDSGMALHTAFVAMRTSEGINELLLQQRLLPNTTTTTFGRPVCFRETRLKTRKQIIEWAFSDDPRNILWMYGAAGSGKGTVITTIANHLRDMCRLGALLVFERGKNDPSTVIRTIAYKLALFDSSIGSRILSEIEKDKDIISASSQQQFNKLLLQPLVAASDSIPGPIILVLDGLDECGTPQSRYGLMQLLRRNFSKLPGAFRFIITSRQEPDINKTLASQPEVVYSMELDYTSADSRNDVLSYLCASMRDAITAQVERPEEWPWDENMKILSNAASGLFVWASTAVNLVSVSDNPFHTLKELVSDTHSVASFGLDQLYGTVLRSSGIAWSSEASRSRFRATMAFVLLSKAPLTSKSIDSMLGFLPEESSVLILSRLQSVLSYSAEEPINVFHASFADHLLSADRSDDPWYIDASAANRLIVERCFLVMKNHLRFNICGLKSSFDCNDDVPDFANRVRNCIPSHLVYACMRWAQHLLEIPYSSGICDRLSEFAYNRLLFWFEALSLIHWFGRIASPALRDAAGWVEGRQDLASFLLDASKLATIFTFPIIQNSTHVYVSMLPLSKDDSQVAAHYSGQFRSLVRIERKGIKKPMMCLKVIDGYAGEIWSIASSPEGRRILTGTTYGYLKVKDFDSTGDLITPVNAHASHIWSVGFSPDGCRIVSGSEDCTIKVHDAHTGRLIHGPLKAHSAPVRKVVFSSNGRKIASGSYDGTIILWDPGLDGNSDPIPATFESRHVGSILSLAFSSDDKQLASGSSDKTVKVWDVASRTPIASPLVHRGEVYAVTLSRDGKQIFSVSADNTIRAWDIQGENVVSMIRRRTVRYIVTASFSPCGTRAVVGFYDRSIKAIDMETGEDVAGPFEGHTSAVTCAVMTTDGKYIVSASQDKTVRIWDAIARTTKSQKLSTHTRYYGKHIATASGDESLMIWDADSGEVVAGPFLGHTGPVNCIVFSKDGSKLFSGSDDRTVRSWDAITGRTISGPFKGHADAVSCIALSPDGLKIASGSDDRTILVRDPMTGELITPPIDVHPASVKALAFYPDGKRLASSLSDRNVVIWDTETWKECSSSFLGQIGQVDGVSFSADGAQAITGSRDGSASIWGTESGHITAGPFVRHVQAVISVCLSSDGKYLVSGSRNSMIRVWDVASKETIHILGGHTDEVRALALSPDGSRLASGSKDKSVRVWDLSNLRQADKEAARRREREDSIFRDTSDWFVGGKGWVRGGPEKRFVLWIPPDLRGTLWQPKNTAVFSCEFSTKLDFTNAAIGERWTECYTPAQED